VGVRAAAAHRRHVARTVLRALDAHRRDQPRARHHLLPDRQPAAGAAVVRVVDVVRIGQQQRQPAGLRGAHHAGHRQHAGALGALLGQRFPAQRAPGLQAALGEGRRALPLGSGGRLAHGPPRGAGPCRATQRGRVRSHAGPRDPRARRAGRDGLSHADVRAGADRHLRRGRGDAGDVRAGRAHARELRGQLPARAAARGTRRALHPALHARLGRAQQPARRDPQPVPRGGPAAGRAHRRPAPARPVGRHARHLVGRVRAHGLQPGRTLRDELRPRPSPALLQLVDGGRRHQARHQLRPQRRLRLQHRGEPRLRARPARDVASRAGLRPRAPRLAPPGP